MLTCDSGTLGPKGFLVLPRLVPTALTYYVAGSSPEWCARQRKHLVRSDSLA